MHGNVQKGPGRQDATYAPLVPLGDSWEYRHGWRPLQTRGVARSCRKVDPSVEASSNTP